MTPRHKRTAALNTFMGLVVMMMLSGCAPSGNKPNAVMVSEPIASDVSSEVIEDTANSESMGKGTLLAESNGITVTIKPTGENKLLHEVTVAVRGGASRMFKWDVGEDTSRPPLINEEDVNGDGIDEIILRLTLGTGTGISVSDIHVLQPGTLEELAVEEPVEALNRSLKSSVTQRNNHTYVSAELEGKHLSAVYDYTEGSWAERIGFGANVSYEVKDGQIVARLAGAASMTEFPLEVIAVYGKSLTIESVKLYYGYLPLSEQETKSAMEAWLGPASGWTFGTDGDQITADFTGPFTGGGQGISYKINPNTGTVYDATSGSPLKSLVNREAIDLSEISEGSKYKEELFKLLQPILDTEGFEPAGKDWISGFIGDGTLSCEVRKGNRAFTIKADVFTGQWEEMTDSYK